MVVDVLEMRLEVDDQVELELEDADEEVLLDKWRVVVVLEVLEEFVEQVNGEQLEQVNVCRAAGNAVKV